MKPPRGDDKQQFEDMLARIMKNRQLVSRRFCGVVDEYRNELLDAMNASSIVQWGKVELKLRDELRQRRPFPAPLPRCAQRHPLRRVRSIRGGWFCDACKQEQEGSADVDASSWHWQCPQCTPPVEFCDHCRSAWLPEDARSNLKLGGLLREEIWPLLQGRNSDYAFASAAATDWTTDFGGQGNERFYSQPSLTHEQTSRPLFGMVLLLRADVAGLRTSLRQQFGVDGEGTATFTSQELDFIQVSE